MGLKARVKATGDIFEVSDTTTIYPEHYDKSYNITEVEFLDVNEKSFPKDEDYWTRLEHQAAIATMQGILSNPNITYKDISMETICNHVPEKVKEIAHALVEKYKKEEKE